MIYAYDQWAQMPVHDLYNTEVMKLSIAAARDMYEKGQQQIKDFNKEYGDFLSPIQNDMNWYSENVTGRVRNAINDLYAAGIDPLRNAEGRAAISRLINSVDTGKINQLRQSAAAAEQYIKNRGALEAAGKYNPDLEERYLGFDMNNWDTLGGSGIWNRTSPVEFQTLKDATNEWYNNRTPGELTKEQVEAFGMTYDPRYRYTGFGDDQLMNIARNRTPGWQNSVYADYYRDIARRQVMARGETPTDNAVEAQLQRNIADAQQEWLVTPKRIVDEFEMQKQKQRDAVALENLRHRHNQALDASRGGSRKENEVTSYGQSLMQRGIANWAGSSDPGRRGLDIAQEFGKRTTNLPWNQRTGAFLDFYGMPHAESTSSFVSRFHGDPSRTKDAATGGVNYVASQDKGLLFTRDELGSRTLGYPGGIVDDHKIRNSIPKNASMVPTGFVYTAPMRDGTYSQFVEVNVSNGGDIQTLYYKVSETEPSPVIESGQNYILNPFSNEPHGDNVVAPAGFSTIPSQATVNKWAIQDQGLNTAAGLAADPVHRGQGYFLDAIPQ